MYYVEWEDLELNEIFNTVTNEDGINFMNAHPEKYDIFILRINEEN